MPLSSLILSSPLFKISFSFFILPYPTSSPLHPCTSLRISSWRTVTPQVLIISWAILPDLHGKIPLKQQSNYLSQTINISKYVTLFFFFFPSPSVFNKDHFHPLKSESKHRNVLLKMLKSVWVTGCIKMYKMLDFLINTAQKRYL